MEKKYETKIKDYTKDIEQNINQEAVLQTIKKCKETFVQAEDYPLSYTEFLYDQMQFIQKRWWILQGCLLAVLWIFLNDAADIYEMQRLMGAGACLFAIFLVPEPRHEAADAPRRFRCFSFVRIPGNRQVFRLFCQ